MYQENRQQSIFQTPAHFQFQKAKLDPNNRWILMAELIPWDLIEEKYKTKFSTRSGRLAKPVRMALGSHLIREKLGLSDRETVEMIKENPYMQFFIGLEGFEQQAPFDPSLMTWFRKRLTAEMIGEVNEYVIGKATKSAKSPPKGGSGTGTTTPDANACEEKTANKGTLIADATCIPSDIRYPTDVSLLSEAREKAEGLIDQLHAKNRQVGERKPRTYRRKARKAYLTFARNRNPKKKDIRKAIKGQLGYVRRDLLILEAMNQQDLTEKEQLLLLTIKTLYEQQQQMYQEETHQVPDRIVSIHSPWVRPIVRGKPNASAEFGAKVAVSVVSGYNRVEKFSWDAFNESTTLIDTIETYNLREGVYPARILADKIYRTREVLRFCKEHEIRISGPKLGRPPKDKTAYRAQCLQEKAEAGERNAVEGIFGTGKRSYSMDRLTVRGKESSEVQIHLLFLSLNLWKAVKVFCASWAQRWFLDFGALQRT